MEGAAAHIAVPGTLQSNPGTDNVHNVNAINQAFNKILFYVRHFRHLVLSFLSVLFILPCRNFSPYHGRYARKL